MFFESGLLGLFQVSECFGDIFLEVLIYSNEAIFCLKLVIMMGGSLWCIKASK